MAATSVIAYDRRIRLNRLSICNRKFGNLVIEMGDRLAQQLLNHQITQLPNSSASPRLRGEIISYYRALLTRYGAQNWWPAQSRFEVIVGAYLTQNTNWTNVEKVMRNLRRANKLSLKAMRDVPLAELETLVRPSGYFRQKARNLTTFTAFLDKQYSGSLDRN